MSAPPFAENKNLDRFRIQPCEADECFCVDFVDELEESNGPVIRDGQGIRVRVIDGGRSRSFLLNDGTTLLMRCDDRERDHKALFCSRCRDMWGGNAALHIMDMPALMLRHGGAFLHASFVLHEGNALLFCGAKQVGKSTQAALWNKYRGAALINGDRALLRKIDGRFYACGSPYCGTSNICENVMAPIRAVVLLSQGGENAAREARAGEAFAAMLDNCSFDPEELSQVEAITAIAAEMAVETAFVSLECRPDESAVETLEEFLWQMKK